MREIKYRAWTSCNTMVRCTGDWSITFDGSKDALITLWCSDGPVDEFVSGDVMQFTGLKDKNGVDIYEGDFLGSAWRTLYVHWCEHCKSFEMAMYIHGCMGCSGDVHWIDAVYADDLEVIGNIHENPELLED